MPIYEFRCRDCGQSFSVMVLSIRTVEPTCTARGSQNTAKLVSAFACHSDEGPIDGTYGDEPAAPAKPSFGRKDLAAKS